MVASHSKGISGPWWAIQGLPHAILTQGHTTSHLAGAGQVEKRRQLFNALPVSDSGSFCSPVIDQSGAQGFT